MSESERVDRERRGEIADSAAKSLVVSALTAVGSAVGGPVGGAAGSALGAAVFEFFGTVPGRRKERTVALLGARLERLESAFQGIVATLRDDEEFVSLMAEIGAVAIRNHRAEKLDALCCALENAALKTNPNETERRLFVRIIDRFDVAHLRLLAYLDDPRAFIKAQTGRDLDGIGGRMDLLRLIGEGLGERLDLAEHVWRELSREGLIRVSELGHSDTTTNHATRGTTELGRRFLRFIQAAVRTPTAGQ